MVAPHSILDLSPLPAPRLSKTPQGERVDLEEIAHQAGMRYVISTPVKPDIRIYPGDFDFKVPRPGRAIYCIGENSLPPRTDRSAWAREVMRHLAYVFHDWAAREIVSRYHRDVKRLQEASDDFVTPDPAPRR